MVHRFPMKLIPTLLKRSLPVGSEVAVMVTIPWMYSVPPRPLPFLANCQLAVH